MNRKAVLVLGALWVMLLAAHAVDRIGRIGMGLPTLTLSADQRAALETGDPELHEKIRSGWMPGPAATEFERFRTAFERFPAVLANAHLSWFFVTTLSLFLLPFRRRAALVDRAGMLLLIPVMYAVFVETQLPRSGWSNWDAWAVWDFKTKAVLHEGWLPRAFLTNPDYGFTHPEYPLLWPWMGAAASWVVGGIDTRVLRLVPLAFAVTMPFILVSLLGEIGMVTGRWLVAGLIATLPIVLNHSSNGYVDWPLAVVEAFALLLAMRWRRGASPAWAVGVAAGVAANLKMEGLLFGIGLLVAMFASAPRASVRIRSGGIAAGLFLLLALPWQVFRISLGITPADFGLPVGQAIVELPGRISLFIGAFLLEAFAAGPNGRTLADWWMHLASSWLVFWFAAGYAVLSGWRNLGDPWLRIPLIVVSVQVLGALGAYVLTVRDVQWLLTTSLDRLMLQWVPAITVISCALLMQKRRVGFSGPQGMK